MLGNIFLILYELNAIKYFLKIKVKTKSKLGGRYLQKEKKERKKFSHLHTLDTCHLIQDKFILSSRQQSNMQKH